MSTTQKASRGGKVRKVAMATAGRGAVPRAAPPPLAPRDRRARDEALRLLTDAHRIMDETERLLRTP
jgi:hypothetical protein